MSTNEHINRVLIGVASVSAVSGSARVVLMVGQKEDPEDFLDKSRREEDGLRALIINSRRLLKRADIPSKSMNAIIEVLKAHEMDEPHLRDAMVEGVKANTVINDSVWASIEDVAEVVDMVMGHRIGKELEN